MCIRDRGKRGTPNYKVRGVKSKDESEWVKVENAHEALVSYEDFMAVKVMMQRDMRLSLIHISQDQAGCCFSERVCYGQPFSG